MVVSEPLNSDLDHWQEVHMSQFLTVCDGAFQVEDFTPSPDA